MSASYRFYRCGRCKKTCKTERIYDGFQFGNPLFNCKHCGHLNYDAYIVEPALIAPKELIKDGQKQYNTELLIINVPLAIVLFFTVLLLTTSVLLPVIITLPVIGLLNWLCIRKKKAVNIQMYSEAINASVNRLMSNPQYAQLVIQMQGNAAESEWSRICFNNYYNGRV